MFKEHMEKIKTNIKDFKIPPKDIREAWLDAARPKYYVATLAPLLLAYIAAGMDTGEWRYIYFTGIILACFFLHLAANLSNDYYDHLSGVDTEDTIGGSRAIQGGYISLQQYRDVLRYLYGAAVVLAVLGVLVTGLWQIFLIIAFAIFASHFYVAPPIRYGYRALGEVFVFLSMGLVMTCGTYFTLTGQWSWEVFFMSVPIGLMVAGILYFQSLPEIESDRVAGKITLANTLGPVNARVLFRLWWPTIWFIIFLLWFFDMVSAYALLGILASVPFHATACRRLDEAFMTGDWFGLDKHGKLVRGMYVFGAIFLILGVALR